MTSGATKVRMLPSLAIMRVQQKSLARSFQVGDQVLVVRRPIIVSHKIGSKFTSQWDGPYVIKEVYTNGAYKIIDADGVHVGLINGKFLKRYYP